MKLNSSFQRGAVLTLMLVGMIAVPVLMHAQAMVDRLTATSVTGAGPGDPVRINIIQWSTDAQRTQLLAALAKTDKDFVTALQGMPTLGYIWTSETAGYLMKYAVKTTAADGSERILIATERRLSAWDKGAKPANDYPFSLIEIRIDAKKVGEGKASVASKVIAEQQAKLLALENYATAPVVLKDVKRVATSGN